MFLKSVMFYTFCKFFFKDSMILTLITNLFLILKPKITMKKVLYVLPIIGMLFFMSCDKDEATIEAIDETAIEVDTTIKGIYDFHKDIMIQSKEGSEALVRVYANSEQSITGYTKANMTLVEIEEDETLKQSLKRQHIMNEGSNRVSEEESMDVDKAEISGGDIAFQLVAITKRNAGVRYAISFNHPDDNTSRASWKYYTHYSTPNQEKIAEIARHSVVRRVYYGLKYKAYSNSSWNTIQNEWKKVSNNESFSHTKNPCYQFRMRVKTKKNSAYTVTFDY